MKTFSSLVLSACLLLASCSEKSPIELALEADLPAITNVVDNLPAHRVQVLFSEVQHDADGGVSFIDHEFQIDDESYHYPASTVKFPVALLALEKLQEIESVNRYSRLLVDGEEIGTSITNEVIELFVLSDDQAYNRLFEFIGKDDINRRLLEKDLRARISHRLSVPDSDRLETRAVEFSTSSRTLYTVGPINNSPIEILPLEDLRQGGAYMEDGKRIEEPFDFSAKNYLPITTLHEIMKRFMFPQAFPASQRFDLSNDHRAMVMRAMSTLPREAGYDESEYPDSYVKFLVFGDRDSRIPEQVKIYNKVGWAYGYLTDSAYIVDAESGREFVISATVHVNANGTFNDDEYEYEEIGIPFLAELGRQLTGL